MSRNIGVGMILTGLMLSSVPWDKVAKLTTSPAKASVASGVCERYEVNCGELFKGRVACRGFNSYGTVTDSWDSQGRLMFLPAAHCVYTRVAR